MNENAIKKAVNNIKLTDSMKAEIMQNCKNAYSEAERKSSFTPHRSQIMRKASKIAAAVAAAIVMCFMLSVPALAANVPAVYDGLYAIAPAAAQYFKPIQLSCEDNGIRMEVISAYIHDDTAEIYLAMTDITGDRLDETVDLFDSYVINTAFDSVGHYEIVSYDDETKTATFLATIQHMNGHPINKSKITFSVSRMLTGKQNIQTIIDSIDPAAAPLSPKTSTESAGLFSDGPHMIPGEDLYSPADGAAITAYGIIDGQLHIQVRYDNVHQTDNHGWLYLSDNSGNTLETTDCVIFDDANSRYYEYIFDISGIELADYTLYGSFTLCDTLIEGDWEVTFPLEDAISD